MSYNIEDAEYFIEDLESLKRDLTLIENALSLHKSTLDRMLMYAHDRIAEWRIEHPAQNIDDDRDYDYGKNEKAGPDAVEESRRKVG